MEIQRYRPDMHYFTLIKWLKERNAYMTPPGEVPRLGFVAQSDGKGVAMGFLRYVEGGFAQLDGLTTNPEATSEQRHQGIDGVVQALLKNAQELGIKSVLAFSSDAGTLVRSLKHGFKMTPHSLIVVDLDKPRI